MIESIPYVLTGIGIIVSILYYTSVLQNANKTRELQLKSQQQAEETRKTQLSTSITEKLGSKDFWRDFVEIATLNWQDIDDYMKRYDSSVNPESYSQRMNVWMAYDNMGYLLREGLVDKEILFNSAGIGSVNIWGRYKPIFDHYRITELGPKYMENFEYLASEMWEMCKARGYTSPGFKDGLTYDRFSQVFEPELEG